MNISAGYPGGTGMRYVYVFVVTALLVITLITNAVAGSQYHVAKIGIGDDLSSVFKTLGTPAAVQIVDSKGSSGTIQLLYFHGKESLAISVTDLPENSVCEIEICGKNWATDLPAKYGTDIDSLTAAIGNPDKIKDVSAQKKWVMDQVGKNASLQSLVEYSVGDTAAYYYKLGLLFEYDKSSKTIKSVRILDPAKMVDMNISVS